MRLKRERISEVKPRRDKAQILCSGYLCPLAKRCQRFHNTLAWQKAVSTFGGVTRTDIVFQSPTINGNGKCVYFVPTTPQGGKRKQTGSHE